jgi:hypothetical protein
LGQGTCICIKWSDKATILISSLPALPVSFEAFLYSQNIELMKVSYFWPYHFTQYVSKYPVSKVQLVWMKNWLTSRNSWPKEPQLLEDKKI